MTTHRRFLGASLLLCSVLISTTALSTAALAADNTGNATPEVPTAQEILTSAPAVEPSFPAASPAAVTETPTPVAPAAEVPAAELPKKIPVAKAEDKKTNHASKPPVKKTAKTDTKKTDKTEVALADTPKARIIYRHHEEMDAQAIQDVTPSEAPTLSSDEPVTWSTAPAEVAPQTEPTPVMEVVTPGPVKTPVSKANKKSAEKSKPASVSDGYPKSLVKSAETPSAEVKETPLAEMTSEPAPTASKTIVAEPSVEAPTGPLSMQGKSVATDKATTDKAEAITEKTAPATTPSAEDALDEDLVAVNKATSANGSSETLTSLHDALAIAYKNNPTLKAERSSLEGSDEALPQALAGWLPTLSANYNRGQEKTQVGSSREEHNSPESRSLSLTQPIFNGGQTINATEQAKSRIKAARARYKQSEQDVMVQAVTAYVDVVRARQVLELSRNNERVLTEQLESTKERFNLGETTRTDVAQSESRLARATSDRINAEGNLVAANAVYKRLLDVEPQANIQMPEKLPDMPTSLDDALKVAMDGNPTLVAAIHNKTAAEKSVSISEASLLPSVSLQASSTREDGLSVLRQGGSRDEDIARINVNVPLYQAGAEYSRVRQAKREFESADHRVEEANNTTVNNVTRAFKDIETSRANIVATQTSVDAAKLALEGVRQEQEIGSRTTLDVLDAEQELFVAQVNLVTARRNEVVSAYNMLAAMGKLTAKDLQLDVPLYDDKAHSKSLRFKLFGLD